MKKNLLKSLVVAGVMMMFPMSAIAAEGGVEINEENFRDDAFRQYVLENFDKDENKVLSQAELDEVTEIDVSGKNEIEFVWGIEYFTELVSLNVEGTSLIVLDISYNTKLEYLASDGVLINEENFPDDEFRADVSTSFDTEQEGWLSPDELNAVTSIYVAGTGIESVEGIEYFTELESLGMAFTSITSLDVSQNTKLEYLECVGADITSLDVSKNTELVTLECYYTGITSLDVSNNIKLETLNCQSTEISSLDISNNIALVELYCGDTKITELDITKNIYLECLSVKSDYFETLIFTDDNLVYQDGDAIMWKVSWFTDESTVLFYELIREFDSEETYEIPDGCIEVNGYSLNYISDTMPKAIIIPDTVEKLYGYCFTFYTYDDSGEIIPIENTLDEIYFKGDVPDALMELYSYDMGQSWWFAGFTGTVYYPEEYSENWEAFIETWSESVLSTADNIGINLWSEVEFVEWGLDIEDHTTDDTTSDTTTTLEREEVFTDGVLEYEIGAIAGVSKLTVSSDNVTLVFDEDALASITAAILAANEANEDYWLYEFSISAVEVDVTTLDEDVQDFVGNRPIFDFSVIATDIYGNSLEITDFGDGSVTVTVPYTLADDETADNLVIYYILDGKIAEVSAIDSYDAENELLTFTVTHFSTYAVGYEEDTTDTDGSDTDDTDTDGADTDDTDTDDADEETSPETGDTSNIALFTILVMISGCGVVVLNRRRHLI